MDELSLYYDEIRKINLENDEQGRALYDALVGGRVPENFVELFSSYISSVNQLSSVLKFAPESIKKLQLPLYAKVLSQLSQEAYVLQIKTLSNQNILDMLQGALQHSAQDFTYQHLVEMCFFELISRRAVEFSGNYQKFIEKVSQDIDYCKSKLAPCTSCIMDNLSEYRYQGQSIIDLINRVYSISSIDQQVLQRQLLEKLRFGQDRRLEYLNKVKNNLTQDYLWLRNTIRQQTQADTHVADEAYANLKRAPLLEAIKQKKTEFSGIKIVYGNDFPDMASETEIQHLKNQSKQDIKKALEKPIVKVHSAGTFSVRLYYLTDQAAQEIKEGNFDLRAENKIFYMDIDNTNHLDESVIQKEIRARETQRYEENKEKRTKLQKNLNEKKRQLMNTESELKKLQVLIEIEVLKKTISANQILLQAQNKTAIASEISLEQKKLDELNAALNTKKAFLDQQLPKLAALKKDLDKKQSAYQTKIANKEEEIKNLKKTCKGYDKSEVNKALEPKKNELKGLTTKLSDVEKNIKQINAQLITNIEASDELPRNTEAFLNEVNTNWSELNSIKTQIQALPQKISELQEKTKTTLTDAEISELTQENESLNEKLQVLLSQKPNVGEDQTQQLQAKAQDLQHEINESNQELIATNIDLNFRRSMFEAIKHNFTAERIGELHLDANDEQKFRRLLELKSTLNEDDKPDWLKEFFSTTPAAHKTQLSEALQKINDQLITDTFELVLNYTQRTPNQKNIYDRSQALKKAEESAKKQQVLQQLLEKLPNSTAATDIKSMLKDAYTKKELQQYLSLTENQVAKLHADMDASVDRLNDMLDALKDGVSFIDKDVAQYIEVIKSIKDAYVDESPPFEQLGFKVKHNISGQVSVELLNDSGKLVKSVQINLDKPLRFSLKKSAKGSYWLSYGGSRGARVSKLSQEGLKRLWTDMWMRGHGQYGSVSESTNLFDLDEVAVKHVFTQSLEALDKGLEANPYFRSLYARTDNLSDTERRINRIFIQQSNQQVPGSVEQAVKLSDYSVDATAIKLSEAQILARGSSLADLSLPGRASYANEQLAFHDITCRQGFDVYTDLENTLAMSHAMVDAVSFEHQLGFVHNDLKPENIMLYKNNAGRWQATLIDRATNAFNLPYQGGKKDLQAIFEEVFPGLMSFNSGSIVLSKEGFYVQQTEKGIYYGKNAALQITHGARNCTLAYIAPETVPDPQSSTDTMMKSDDTRMDNWALTAMVFGVCNKEAYFALATGRSVGDYVVPGVIALEGETKNRLYIPSPQTFNRYFGCGLGGDATDIATSNLMFIPANFREGEPKYLYRDLQNLWQKLEEQKSKNQAQSQYIQETQQRIDFVLQNVAESVQSGKGLTTDQLKSKLLDVEKIYQDSLKIAQGEVQAKKIDKKLIFQKALQERNLRKRDKELQQNMLNVLCLLPSNAEEIRQAQDKLRNQNLTDLFFGETASNSGLISDCLHHQQEEMAVFLINQLDPEQLKEKIKEENLLAQAIQQGMPKVFFALLKLVDTKTLLETPNEHYVCWKTNVLVSAIIQHQDDMVKKIIELLPDDLGANQQAILEAMFFCAKNNEVNYFLMLRKKYKTISDEEILGYKPCPFSLFMMYPSASKIFESMQKQVYESFLTGANKPLLVAGRYGNFEAVSLIAEQAQNLDKPFITEVDLDGKNILNYLLERDAPIELIKLFLQGPCFEDLMKRNNPIKAFVNNDSKKEDFKFDRLNGILGDLKSDTNKQLIILLSIQDWLVGLESNQQVFDLLRSDAINEKNRLVFLELLASQNEKFISIKEEYLPGAKAHQSKLVIPEYLEPIQQVFNFVTENNVEYIKQLFRDFSTAQTKNITKTLNRQFQISISIAESLRDLEKAKTQGIDALISKVEDFLRLSDETKTELQELQTLRLSDQKTFEELQKTIQANQDIVKNALNQQIEEVNNQLNQNLSAVASIKGELSSKALASDVKSLSSTLENLQSAFDSKLAELSSLQALTKTFVDKTTFKELETSFQDRQQKFAGEIESAHQALKAYVENKISELQTTHAGSVEELKQDLAEKETELKSIQQLVKGNQELLGTQQQSISEMLASNKEQQEKWQSLESQFQTLSSAQTLQASQLQGLLAEVQSFTQKYVSNEDLKTNLLQHFVNQLNSEIQGLNQRIKDLDAKVKDLPQLKEEQQALQSTIDSLPEQFKQQLSEAISYSEAGINEKILQLTTQLGANIERIEKISKDMASTQDIGRLTKELTQLRDDFNFRYETLQKLEPKLSEQQSLFAEKFEKANQALQEKVNAIEDRLTQTTEKIQEISKQISTKVDVTQLDDFSKELAQLKQTFQSNLEQLTTLQESMQSLVGMQTSRIDETIQAQNVIFQQSLNAANQGLSERIISLETKLIQEINQSKTKLDGQIAELSSQGAKGIRNAQSQLSAFQQQVEEKLVQLQTLKEIFHQKADKSALEQMKGDFSRSIDEANQSFNAQVIKLGENLNTELKSLGEKTEAQVVSLNEALNKKATAEEVQSLTTNLENLQSDFDSKLAELSTLQALTKTFVDEEKFKKLETSFQDRQQKFAGEIVSAHQALKAYIENKISKLQTTHAGSVEELKQDLARQATELKALQKLVEDNHRLLAGQQQSIRAMLASNKEQQEKWQSLESQFQTLSSAQTLQASQLQGLLAEVQFVNQLNTKIQGLNQRIEGLDAKVEDLPKLKEEQQALQSTIDSLPEQFKQQLSEAISYSEAGINQKILQLTNQLGANIKRIEQISKDMASTQDIGGLANELTQLRDDFNLRYETLQKLEPELSKQQSLFAEKFEKANQALQEKVNAIEVTLTQTTKNIQEISKQISTKVDATQLDDFSKDLAQLKQTFQSNLEQLTTLKDSMKSLVTKEEIESINQAIKEQVTLFKQQIDTANQALESRVATVEEELRESKTQIAQLTAQISQLTTKDSSNIIALQESLSSLNQKFQEQVALLESLNKQMTQQVKTDIAQLKSEVHKSLDEANQALARTVADLATKLEQVSGDLNATKLSLAEIERKNEQLLLQNSQILEHFAELRSMYQELKEQQLEQKQTINSLVESKTMTSSMSSQPNVADLHQQAVVEQLQVPHASSFKLRLHALKLNLPEPFDDIMASINFDPTELDNYQCFTNDSGATVYTNQGQAYQFKYDPNAPPVQAVLLKNQLPATDDNDRDLKIALTIMNMMENVLSKGEKLLITTKDPFIAKIAQLYIEEIKKLKVGENYPFSAIESSVSPLELTDEVSEKAQGIFSKIIDSQAYRVLISNPSSISWVCESPLNNKYSSSIRPS